MKKDINSLNILRCIGILLVVLRHSLLPYISQDSWPLKFNYEQNYYIGIFAKYVSTFSMPLFVFISGFIFSYLRISLGKYNTNKGFISKKIKRLLIPFLILSPLYIITFFKVKSLDDLLWHLMTSPGHFWFIIMLFIIFIIFYQVEEFLKKNIKYGIILTLIFFSTYPILAYLKLIPIANTFKYFPFFYLGYLFYSQNEIIEKFIKNKKYLFLLIHTVLFLIYLYILELTKSNNMIIKIISYYYILPIGCVATLTLYSFFTKLSSIKNKYIKNAINQINNNSYYIYIIHQPLLILFYNLEFISSNPYQIIIISGFCLSIFSSIILSKILNKSRYGRMLIGA